MTPTTDDKGVAKTSTKNQPVLKDLEAKILDAMSDAKAMKLDLLAYLLEMSLQELIETDCHSNTANQTPGH